MDYVAIFHANLNYAFLIPQNYERVIRASYEVIIDTFNKHPDAKYVFEASGYTIEQMAIITPDVLEKLKAAIARGQCEFMGAPYSHPLMANIPEEDGYWSCEFAQRVFEKHLGFRPESFWNPECTWMQYVPSAFQKAGVKYLTLDFESYMTCTDKEYSWVERNRAYDMNWGGHLPWYPLDPDCPFLHQPFRNIVPGLHGMCRSDRLIGKYLTYFRGSTTIEDFIENMKYWSGKKNKGSLVIIADDAEYCGTTGYYYIKYFNDYSRSFDIEPTAGDKLDVLIREVTKVGPMITFKESCEKEAVTEPFFVEDRFAWHRTYANAWANTPEALHYDPQVNALRNEYKRDIQPIAESSKHGEEYKQLVDKFWYHLTNSANSDGRWPPPPRKTCPFNREWVEAEIKATTETLAALKTAVQKYVGTKCEDDGGEDENLDAGIYGFSFTKKDKKDIANLNIYELQHAIYEYHAMVDAKDQAISAEGKKWLRLVFDELEKRGIKGNRPKSIQ